MPHIMKFRKISENVSSYTNAAVTTYHHVTYCYCAQLTEVVCREVLQETMDEDQASVLSYFIQTAKVRPLIFVGKSSKLWDEFGRNLMLTFDGSTFQPLSHSYDNGCTITIIVTMSFTGYPRVVWI